MLGVLFTIGAIGTAISPNVHTLIAFRIELGIAVEELQVLSLSI